MRYLPFREHDQQRHGLQVVISVDRPLEIDLLQVLQARHHYFRPRHLVTARRHVEITRRDRDQRGVRQAVHPELCIMKLNVVLVSVGGQQGSCTEFFNDWVQS